MFMKVTKALENNASTINLSLVLFVDLKQEIEAELLNLEDPNTDFEIELKNMYGLTLRNLEKRYRISDEMVLASMLDPAFQNLDYIRTYLVGKKMNKTRFIKKMYLKYVGEIPAPKRDELKKACSMREHLAMKHSSKVHSSGTLEKDIEVFETINHDFDDILQWYGKVGVYQFPLLSQLARVILQLSATSATIERLNSKARRIITYERTNLSTTKINKMIITQFNFPVLKKVLNN